MPLLVINNTAQAAIVAPDSPPSLAETFVNRNLVETGDRLFYALYDIPYATLPSVDSVTIPADLMFVFRLMSADGATELGTMTPFIYFDAGYNRGLISWYFPASANITWDVAYIIRISQNPTYFPSPEYVDVVLSLDAYTSETGQEDNQGELATNLYDMGQRLESEYDVTLFQSSGSQMILTTEGEQYFRGAISGLQVLAPSLFLIQYPTATIVSENWTTEQFNTYQHRFDGTWVGTSENATAEQFGGTADVVFAFIIIVPICLGFIIFASLKYRRAEPGYLVAPLILTMGALLGWVPIALFATFYQLMAIYIAYLIFFARG